LKPVDTSVESAWFQRLTLEYDTPLSSFAFNFNLRHYNLVNPALDAAYVRKKREMTARLGTAGVNERLLFHGTTFANSEGIARENFRLDKVGRVHCRLYPVWCEVHRPFLLVNSSCTGAQQSPETSERREQVILPPGWKPVR